MGNMGLVSILKSTWDWQTNKQTNLKITKPVGSRRDGGAVSQECSSDRSVAFLCHEPPFMWDKLTHCGKARCFQHLFLNSTQNTVQRSAVYRTIVPVIYSPFIWNVIRLTHIMVSLWRCFIHIWDAVWWLGCWWTPEGCWKACVIRPLISDWNMFGLLCPFSGLHLCTCVWGKRYFDGI